MRAHQHTPMSATKRMDADKDTLKSARENNNGLTKIFWSRKLGKELMMEEREQYGGKKCDIKIDG